MFPSQRKFHFVIFFVLICSFVFLSYAYIKLALNSFPYVDEFCYAANFNHSSLWDFQRDIFLHWTSRYFSNLMMALNPLRYHSIVMFQISGCVNYIFITLFSYLACQLILKKENFLIKMNITLAFLNIYFWGNFSPYENTINFTYFWSYLISGLLLSLFISLKLKQETRLSKTLQFVIGLIIVGGSELGVLLLLSTLAYFFLRDLIKKKSFSWNLSLLFIYLILFVIIFSLAGNSKQFHDRGFETIPNFQLVDLITFYNTYLKRNWGFLIIELIGGGFFLGHISHSGPYLSKKEILLSVLYCTFTFMALILLFPAIQKIQLVGRQQNLIWYLYSGIVFLLSYEWGKYYKAKNRISSIFSVPLIYVLYFHASPFWGFVFKTNWIEEYSKIQTSLEKDYLEKRISSIPIYLPPYLSAQGFYPVLDYLKNDQNFASCISRYYKIPNLVFEFQEIPFYEFLTRPDSKINSSEISLVQEGQNP